MNADGVALCLRAKDDQIPLYAQEIKEIEVSPSVGIPKKQWRTLFISGGRRDKISKGDIVGLFIKKGGLRSDELGMIELKTDCAYIAVSSVKANGVCQKVTNQRLKKKKVRVYALN